MSAEEMPSGDMPSPIKIGSDGSAAPSRFSNRGMALVGQEMFKVLDKARKLEEAGIRVYHLELGNPRRPPPMEIIDATLSALTKLNVGYTSSAGLPELRRAVAKHYSSVMSRPIDMSNVVISPANLLINQCLDLTCDRGDKVVVFSPGFPSYYAAAAHIGLDLIDVPLDAGTAYQLSERDVEIAVEQRPRAIIVNSANNPTGAVYSQRVLKFLARTCKQYGIWLISDETYADICFGERFYSLIHEDYAQLIVISSFSKIFSIPGFRIGYAIGHDVVAGKLALSNSTLISCMPAFTQLGCVAGMEVIDSYKVGLSTHFGDLARECTDTINRSGVLHCAMPQAGLYIFLDISVARLDDLCFADRLLEERHTAVTPGRSFGQAYKHHVRIATCGNREDVLRGVGEVVSFARELACSQPFNQVLAQQGGD